MALLNIRFSAKYHILSIVDQLAVLNWKFLDEIVSGKKDLKKESVQRGVLDQLSKIQDLMVDVENGICPIPLYEFDSRDWSCFQHDAKAEEREKCLRSFDVWQYFFPSRDRLVLDLLKRGDLDKSVMERCFQRAVSDGHIFSENEFSGSYDFLELIDDLKARGYVLYVDREVKLTKKGKEKGGSIKYCIRPREALAVQLLRELKLVPKNLNLHWHQPS